MTKALDVTRGRPQATTADVQEAIIRVAQHSYERLPLLEVLMGRVAQALGPALRAALNVQADVTLDAMDYLACGDAMAAAPDPGLIALATASPWDGSVAVTLDPALLFTTLEIMLGASDPEEGGADHARKSDPPDWTPRAFTTIEKRLGAQLVSLALREVAAAFAPLDTVSFKAGAIESGPRDILFTPATAACVRVRIGITLDGRGGHLCLIIPHRTLDAVRPMLARPGVAAQLGGDPGWRAQLEETLNHTPVTLTAVLHQADLPLADVLAWVPGQVLDLGIDSTHEVTVSSSGRDLFRAAIGRRKNGSVALRVTAAFEETKEETAHGHAD
ncbi:MAG: FliM/FliN family flagellar motor switch protein [Paracoccaceae bacterium]|nr:FliM/FliN family flagellar motor switch protein [Paracoccaceae bacterium]